jgi:hypothetical protein
MSNPVRLVFCRGAVGFAAVFVAAAMTVVGCGSSSHSATSKTTFCSDAVGLNSVGAAGAGGSMPQLAQIFKAHNSQIEAVQSSAPSPIKASAVAVVNAIEAFINSGGSTNFNDQPASVISAGNAIDSYCGANDFGGPPPSTPGEPGTT